MKKIDQNIVSVGDVWYSEYFEGELMNKLILFLIVMLTLALGGCGLVPTSFVEKLQAADSRTAGAVKSGLTEWCKLPGEARTSARNRLNGAIVVHCNLIPGIP